MKLVAAPVEPLDARELGRLLNALDGQSWLAKRDMAPIAVMARAGICISEVLALKVADLEINPRSGKVLVRHGKGSKERRSPLPAEARAAVQAYLKVRPKVADDRLFLSRTLRPPDRADFG